MSSKVSDNKLLKKCSKICERVSNLMDQKFDSEPVYGDKINTNFQGKKIPKENASYKCLSFIRLDSNRKYYPQTFLEECKYETKKNTMENLINDDLDLRSSNESDIGSDNEF